jgi:hypothetical protein
MGGGTHTRWKRLEAGWKGDWKVCFWLYCAVFSFLSSNGGFPWLEVVGSQLEGRLGGPAGLRPPAPVRC